ncbi:DUF3618 domain-containing protein [Actinophytocola sp.]|uniref:DUF3618 domain-containing protein n=1 Tax=Actinophytocola sp. TaxID=1872138 RepID=UPI002ED08848
MTDNDERLTIPAQPPTDEDLRQDADLTRQELAETVAALGEKADVKARVQRVAHDKAKELRQRGDELVDKLPDSVATRVRPVVTGATNKPMIPLATLIAFLLVLRFLLKRRAAR